MRFSQFVYYLVVCIFVAVAVPLAALYDLSMLVLKHSFFVPADLRSSLAAPTGLLILAAVLLALSHFLPTLEWNQIIGWARATIAELYSPVQVVIGYVEFSDSMFGHTYALMWCLYRFMLHTLYLCMHILRLCTLFPVTLFVFIVCFFSQASP